MAARAMWKAELDLPELRVPVKMYAAIQDRAVRFRLLHAADNAPVKQQMVDPQSGEPVPSERIRRGIEVERDTFVVLTPDEHAALGPKASRAITIDRVVDSSKVEERWYDRPYYLGPDERADERYFALAAALAERDWVGIAHWAMRKQSYVGALHASHGYLMLETLRHSDEIVAIGAVHPPANRAPDPRELALAEQLIDALYEERFDPSDYRDEYRDKLLALIEAKSEGTLVRLPKAAPRAPSDASDLLKQLRASLKAPRRASGA